jgi:hypothetical protein
MPVKKNHYAEFKGEPEEVAYAVRLEMAHDAWINANGALSIQQSAQEHRVKYKTLRDQVKGAKPKAVDVESRQRLSAREEIVIQKHVQQLKV